MSETPKALLRAMFDAAVDAADASHCLPPHLPPPPDGRTVVVGAGKAAGAMAQAVEQHWTGALSGLVVAPYGHGRPTRRIEMVEAAHPIPDQAGQAAARRVLGLVAGLSKHDLLLCLISGGGSALLSCPAAGLSLADKRTVTDALLRCGATIREINTVRKHLSAIKGGRLGLAAHPAQIVALLISDVPGDDPAVIASGPTLPDPTTAADARAVLERYAIRPPPAVLGHLAGSAAETPKPGDPRLAGSRAVMLARPRDSLEAAAAIARSAGVTPIVLGDDVEGEAREVGADHAFLAVARRRDGPPMVLISGGETTVTVTGSGRGGRNTEYLLGLAMALNGADGISALAADTDGIDGSEANAGAFIAPDTLRRAAAAGLEPAAMLADNDAYSLFAALDDLLITGPTRTNVNDFRAVLIQP